jgi:hypothetical protein
VSCDCLPSGETWYERGRGRSMPKFGPPFSLPRPGQAGTTGTDTSPLRATPQGRKRRLCSLLHCTCSTADYRTVLLYCAVLCRRGALTASCLIMGPWLFSLLTITHSASTSSPRRTGWLGAPPISDSTGDTLHGSRQRHVRARVHGMARSDSLCSRTVV